MIAEHQTALEALAGRALTADEIAMAEARQDATLAASLSVGRVGPVPVARGVFAMWAGATKLRESIEDAAVDKASPLRSSALTLLDFLRSSRDEGIELNRAENQAMLNEWVSAGAISSEQIAALQSLGTAPAPLSAEAITNIFNSGVSA